MRRDPIKLSTRHRAWLYSFTGVIYCTGLVWACSHYFTARDEFGGAPAVEPWMMKLHGGAAMGVFVLLGTLLPVHMRLAWKARRNRANALVLLGVIGFLALSGYGLYYAGGENLRAWTSWLHLGVGISLPAFLVLHIWLGRRSRRRYG